MSVDPTLPPTRLQVNDRVSARTSMFLLATMRCIPASDELPFRVRNLSSTGLCGDSKYPVLTGERYVFAIPSVGNVEGVVAWCEGDRFGASFATEIDPERAKRPVSRTGSNANILPPVRDHRRPGVRSSPSSVK